MPGRIKGKTLVTRDEGDDANGVLIKLYGEETNGAISIIQQPFEPGLLLPPHVHENDNDVPVRQPHSSQWSAAAHGGLRRSWQPRQGNTQTLLLSCTVQVTPGPGKGAGSGLDSCHLET